MSSLQVLRGRPEQKLFYKVWKIGSPWTMSTERSLNVLVNGFIVGCCPLSDIQCLGFYTALFTSSTFLQTHDSYPSYKVLLRIPLLNMRLMQANSISSASNMLDSILWTPHLFTRSSRTCSYTKWRFRMSSALDSQDSYSYLKDIVLELMVALDTKFLARQSSSIFKHLKSALQLLYPQ